MESGPRFNPLDTRAIGAHVVEALLSRPAEPLGEISRFVGAGIYAIYYTGTFPPYGLIARENRDKKFGRPIYVGKAIPAGGRKGGAVLADEYTGTALFSRLAEHADSVKVAGNLNIGDFFCRYLVVDDVWIPLAESLLIASSSPLWNRLIDGFGNHDPGSGRYSGMRPRWDTLHPGRSWAAKCKERPETADQISAEVESHLRLGSVGLLDLLGNGDTNGEDGNGPNSATKA